MQNIAEKSVSLVFRASQGRGLQKFFRGQAPGPPCLLATLAPCPPKSRDLATPLVRTFLDLPKSSYKKESPFFQDDLGKSRTLYFSFIPRFIPLYCMQSLPVRICTVCKLHSKNPQNRNHFIRSLRLIFLRNGALIYETTQPDFRTVSYRRIPHI